MRTAAALILLLLLGAPAGAQDVEPSIDGPSAPAPPEVIARDDQGRITVRATRVPSPFVFDGVLEEAFYGDVPSFSEFIQQEPRQGQPATERTEVWVFYDRQYLYVSARVWETDISQLVATEMRRDANNLYNNDHFGVSFDSFYDRRNGYGFAVNPQGGMLDWSITNEQPNNSWNGVWMVRTGRFDGGWTLEIRFPFRSFRFREGGHTWGMNFRRRSAWKNEVSFLAPVQAAWGRPALSRMSVAATVADIEVPGKGLNIDVKPYGLGSRPHRSAGEPARRQRPGRECRLRCEVGRASDRRRRSHGEHGLRAGGRRRAAGEPHAVQPAVPREARLLPRRGGHVQLRGCWRRRRRHRRRRRSSGQRTEHEHCAGDLFYSRRIGLTSTGLDVPIRAGGRLLGRSGMWRYGLLNIQTAESTLASAAGTNFTVVRVNRDIFRRSRIGGLYTRRDPVALARPGTDPGNNLSYGLDALINPTPTVSVLAYAAKTTSPSRTGDDSSYRGRFDWAADRYGLQAEHLHVGRDFNPEVGFLRRTAFERSYGQARFSPRPNRHGMRKIYFVGNVDYITDPNMRPESKEVQGSFQMDFNNSDTWLVEVSRNYERLVTRFEVGTGVYVPPGEYTFEQVRGTYTFGTQRPVSGAVTVARGGFYDGALTELTYRGRVELSTQLYLEPTLSWNRVEVPQGLAKNNLFSTRATYTITTRMFVSALVQYQSRTSSITSNARFRWEYIPGSELFVVYSDGRTTLTEGFPEVESRSLVVKVTRLLRW